MIKIIISIMILTSSLCVTLDLSKRCACSEFDKIICEQVPYCTYLNRSCQPVDCKLLTVDKCSGSKTELNCKWNKKTRQCEEYDYECYELNAPECQLTKFSKNCLFDHKVCQDYDECQGTDEKSCNLYECSYSKEAGCGEPYNDLICEGTDQDTCAKSNGKGKLCGFDDEKQCRQISVIPSSCEDFTSFSLICPQFPGCRYISSTKECVSLTCADYKSERECMMVVDVLRVTVTPCIWKKRKCQEATKEDIEDMGMLCMAYTALNYKWDVSSEQCEFCADLVDHPEISAMKQKQQVYNSSAITLSISFGLIMNLLLG